MSTDRRLDKQSKLVRAQIRSARQLLDYLDKHLPDVQSLAWDQPHPEANYPSEMDEAERQALRDKGITPPDPSGPSQADRCRSLIQHMSSKQGMAKVEDALIGYARAFAKAFAGPAPDNSLRGTLLGRTDKDGNYVPGSEKEELGELLGALVRRNARAPRTGETAHTPIEEQKMAPRERGIDANLRNEKAS